ncbi:FxLYD domain-containing protein [Halanaerobium hydrogeniformans]|uniref:Uncharacterized protein n=1 Tax=Halanaerobium hydrogeniformans TaxID=656519 RepID=E4RMJ6_HALHG|nr:FxLYD domain-containing protein [Halanaerobium hydrogeniformans]ADQ14527.1 hypothetical protein Halsa_1095 [Halanaerobium hydrogeniformans]
MKKNSIFVIIIFVLFILSLSSTVLAQELEITYLNYYTENRIDISELRYYGNPTPNLFDYKSVIVGEIRNNSSTDMTSVKIIIELYDPEEQEMLATGTARPLASTIKAGETIPFSFPISALQPHSLSEQAIRDYLSLEDQSQDWDEKINLFTDPRFEFYLSEYREVEHPSDNNVFNHRDLEIINLQRMRESNEQVYYDFSVQQIDNSAFREIYGGGLAVYGNANNLIYISSLSRKNNNFAAEEFYTVDYNFSIPKHIDKYASEFEFFAIGTLVD